MINGEMTQRVPANASIIKSWQGGGSELWREHKDVRIIGNSVLGWEIVNGLCGDSNTLKERDSRETKC